MSYKRVNSNNFADFQLGEGFGSAVTGNSGDLSIKQTSEIAQKDMKALPAGLQGYEGYTDSFGQLEGSGGSNTGLEGFGESSSAQGSFGEVSDDAFAGYGTEKGLSDAQVAAEPESNANVYGVLPESPVESFHTFLHQAAGTNSEMEVISLLAAGVKSVPDNAPPMLKKQYYDLAIDMLKKKKATNMRHLDMQRAEIESNIGWLINPRLPKTGGFNAMLKVAAGTVGTKLAQGTPTQIKEAEQMQLGEKLKQSLADRNLSGLNGTSNTVKYLGLGILGLIIAGVAHYYLKKPTFVTAKKRKRK